MPDFRLIRQDELSFDASGELAGMYKLSPCVWFEDGLFKLLLRVVNVSDDPSKKIARIHYGWSPDGLHFALDQNPAIEPEVDSPEAPDSGGCEDPTLARVDGIYYVYYSGWNEYAKRGQLLLTAGPDIHHLRKLGIALQSSERAENPKEATLVQAPDGTWRLFFEYAQDNRSKIGLARSSHVSGPWEVLPPLFEARPDLWDSHHLSTGPILDSNPDFPVMFYNGASDRAAWRIGWIVFDAAYERVLERGLDPVITPDTKRNADDTDVAFAASSLEIDGEILLYYSVADRYVCRAIIRRA